MTEHRRNRRRANDERGMTMVEVLIALVVIGVLFSAVLAALSLTTRQVNQTKEALTIDNDSQFVLTYLARDLSSSTQTSVEPDAQPVAGTVLPGTNVLQASWSRSVGQGGSADESTTVVAYRYVQSNGVWGLERLEYRSTRPGDPLTLYNRQVLATSLAPPPSSWSDGVTAPGHALSVVVGTTPNSTRPTIAFSMTMSDGTTFRAGGSNSAKGPVAARPDGETWVNPTSSSGRCVGRIALILDTSGSVPLYGGGYQLEQAAAGFIDGLADMSMSMSIIGFDREAYPMYPSTGFGSYFSLNDAAQRTAARDRIVLLDDQDGAYDYRDAPTTDGIHWQQTAVPYVDPDTGETYFYEGGTNWEDGLWHALRDDSGNVLAGSQLPTLAVFITDGEPNQIRPAVTGGVSAPVAVDRAKVAAAELEGRGVQLIGVGVGTAFTNNPAALPNLAAVVGSNQWNGESPGNAADADVFVGNFSELGQILNTITSTRCVAAAALQPVSSTGTAAFGLWAFYEGDVERISDSTLDPVAQFNFPMVGSPRRWVDIWMIGPATTKGVDRVECRSGGVALGPDRVEFFPDVKPNEGAIRLNVAVNESMSCKVIEKP